MLADGEGHWKLRRVYLDVFFDLDSTHCERRISNRNENSIDSEEEKRMSTIDSIWNNGIPKEREMQKRCSPSLGQLT